MVYFAEDQQINAECMYFVFHRPFCENVLQCKIEIAKKRASAEPVLEPVCALLNSGGGILEMEITDISNFKFPLKQLDEFWSTLEEKVKSMISPSEYADVFDRVVREEDGKVFLFIKAPNHLCTVNFNNCLFLPLDAKTSPASYQKVKELLSKKNNAAIPQDPLKHLPLHLLPKRFRYKQVLNFHESKQVQLKNFPPKNGILHNNNQTQRESIKKQISAFGNGSGGMILLGVKDNGEVHGQDMQNDSIADITSRVVSIIKEMSTTWSFSPERKVHWEIEFFPIAGMDSNFVIVIYVAGMRNLGGIFAKYPKSFELRPGFGGEVVIHCLDFEEWKQRILCGTNKESKGWYIRALSGNLLSD